MTRSQPARGPGLAVPWRPRAGAARPLGPVAADSVRVGSKPGLGNRDRDSDGSGDSPTGPLSRPGDRRSRQRGPSLQPPRPARPPRRLPQPPHCDLEPWLELDRRRRASELLVTVTAVLRPRRPPRPVGPGRAQSESPAPGPGASTVTGYSRTRIMGPDLALSRGPAGGPGIEGRPAGPQGLGPTVRQLAAASAGGGGG